MAAREPATSTSWWSQPRVWVTAAAVTVSAVAVGTYGLSRYLTTANEDNGIGPTERGNGGGAALPTAAETADDTPQGFESEEEARVALAAALQAPNADWATMLCAVADRAYVTNLHSVAVEALNAAVEVDGVDANLRADAMKNLTVALFLSGDPDGAIEAATRAIATHEDLLRAATEAAEGRGGGGGGDESIATDAMDAAEHVAALELSLAWLLEKRAAMTVDSEAALGDYTAARARLGRTPGPPTDLDLRVVQGITSVLTTMERWNDALASASDELTTAEQVNGTRECEDVGKAIHGRGRLLLMAGRLDEGLAALQEALHILDSATAGNRSHPQVVATVIDLGNIHNAMGSSQAAIDCYSEALRALEAETGERADPRVARTQMNLGTAYDNLGDYASALGAHREALRVFKEVHGGKFNFDVASTLNNIANVHRRQERYDEAEAGFLSALEILDHVFAGSRENPTSTAVLKNLAWVCAATGRLGESVDLVTEAAAARTAYVGNTTDPTVVSLLTFKVDVLTQDGRPDEALDFLREMEADAVAAHGGSRLHADVLDCITSQGNVEYGRGNMEAAAAKIGEAAALAVELGIDAHTVNHLIYSAAWAEKAHGDTHAAAGRMLARIADGGSGSQGGSPARRLLLAGLVSIVAGWPEWEASEYAGAILEVVRESLSVWEAMLADIDAGNVAEAQRPYAEARLSDARSVMAGLATERGAQQDAS